MSGSIYVASDVLNKQLIKSDRALIETLRIQHITQKTNIANITDDESKQNIKKNDSPVAYFSATGDANMPNDSLKEINFNDAKVKGILRDFIVIDYDLDKAYDDANKIQDEFKNRIMDLFQDYPYALYPSISWPTKPRWRFVLPVDTYMSDSNYKYVTTQIVHLIDYETGDSNNESIFHGFNMPRYSDITALDQAIFKVIGQPYSIKSIIAKAPKPKRNPAKEALENITFNNKLLETALRDFMNDQHVREQLEDYNYFWKFLESLALASIKNLLPRDFIQLVLVEVAMDREDWKTNNAKLFEEYTKRLTNDPSKQALVRPITAYLPLVAQVDDADNLGQLLLKLLPPTFEPNAIMPPAAVAEIIANLFEFAILPYDGSNSENVALFNPLSGYWEHNDDNLLALINTIRPTTSAQIFAAILGQWGSQANTANRYIKPYDGSRYLLFNNTVLDIKTEKQYDLNSQVVRDLQFVQRNLINIRYANNPTPKVYEHDGYQTSEWSIEKFIDGYTEDSIDKKEYLLFLLMLGALPNHNTGVNVSIQGLSGRGKSTLNQFYAGLYKRISIIDYKQLNDDFPITPYDNNYNVVWVKENNEGSAPLSDENGIPIYDGFADSQLRLPVKHGGDLIINNPPQLFVDGTQFIQANDVDTGPARRTLAFKMPTDVKWLHKYYGEDINVKLQDEENLQWLMYNCIQAFKKVVPENKIDNFKLNLNIEEDLNILPSIAIEWRKEIVSTDSRIEEWFKEELVPFISEKTLLHNQILYELYGENYRRSNPNDTSRRFMMRPSKFEKAFNKIIKEYKLSVIPQGSSRTNNSTRLEKKISRITSLNFDWSAYNERYSQPTSLSGPTPLPDLFGKRQIGWFTIGNLDQPRIQEMQNLEKKPF